MSDTLTEEEWSEDERASGRQCHVGMVAKDWPHFKAYFEHLGWEVTPVSVAAHSGYVAHARFKTKES